MDDQKKKSTQQIADSASKQEEEFDFSELQGLSCGPEGCSIPDDYFSSKKNSTHDKD